jgi:hypothetical protein
MVEVFKTNIFNDAEAQELAFIISDKFPGISINFDLEDCDKILRVEGHQFNSHQIIDLVTRQGYSCAVLED